MLRHLGAPHRERRKGWNCNWRTVSVRFKDSAVRSDGAFRSRRVMPNTWLSHRWRRLSVQLKRVGLAFLRSARAET